MSVLGSMIPFYRVSDTLESITMMASTFCVMWFDQFHDYFLPYSL